MEENPFAEPSGAGDLAPAARTAYPLTDFRLPHHPGRFVAYYVDYFLFAAAVGVALAVPFVVWVSVFRPEVEPEAAWVQTMDALVWPLTIAMAVGMALVFALFESSPLQATPGKWLFGFKVINSDGTRMTFAQALGRNAAKTLLLSVCGVVAIVVLVDDERRGPWGSMSRTRVVKPGRRPPPA